LTDRSIGSEEKRRLILDAAVRVWARDGFHTSPVGAIAAEAGVAHGLMYHYFSSKDELLETIFRETWSALLRALQEVEESGQPATEQLRLVCAIVLRTWKRDPDLVRVLVREVTRSPHLGQEVDEIAQAFAAIERIVAAGQERGELRADVEPRLAASIVYGALEEILTGWVFAQQPDGEDDVAAAERAVTAVVTAGLAPVPVTATA
jgi:TetR/AcrR family transcriptional regulator, fatty acid metabolism regulator protein